MPRDTTAPIRKFLILSNDPAGWIREGFIVPNDATVSVREGLIMPHEGMAQVREGPIMSHEGMASVASVFSGSLFITEQTLSEIKQRLFYCEQVSIGNKKSPVYTQ